MDAYPTATKGKSDLKTAFDPRLDLGKYWWQIPQIIHEVIKAPLRRIAFENSLARQIAAVERAGGDASDPLTQLAMQGHAYADSDRALLLENNRLANSIRNWFKEKERAVSPGPGRPAQVPLGGKALATLGKVELPILTVPFNYIKQTLVANLGLVSGSVKLHQAFKEGVDKLSDDERDQIMRHLKYGTIGTAMALYGFYDGYHNANDPKNSTFGGYWQPGEKRGPEQAGVGGAKIGGVKIPGLLLHNPVLAVGQLWHTIGAITAQKINKKSDETRGITAGMAAGAMGLMGDSPIGYEPQFLQQMRDPRTAGNALARHVSEMVTPQFSQDLAKDTDKDAQGNPIKRKPSSMQNFEMGIPGLRQNVPLTPTPKHRTAVTP
jgi:hypothetical protein